MNKVLYKFTQAKYLTINKERSFYESALIKFAMVTHIGKLLSSDKILKSLDRVLQKYDYDKAKYVWNFWSCYGKRKIVPKYQLSDDRKGMFEGVIVNISEDAEGYLTGIYGDYMKLPTIEERKGHTIKFAD